MRNASSAAMIEAAFEAVTASAVRVSVGNRFQQLGVRVSAAAV
jgi:hypothetical protein